MTVFSNKGKKNSCRDSTKKNFVNRKHPVCFANPCAISYTFT